jgi:hypothetical protein
MLGFMMILGWFRISRPKISTLLIFQAYLLISAMIVNGLWSCIIWGRFYWSVDYTSDFSVFMPIRRSQVADFWGAKMTGGLNGTTLTQLNLIWASFAVLAWVIAVFATRWFNPLLVKSKKNKPVVRTVAKVPDSHLF